MERFYGTILLKEFGVLGTPRKTYELIRRYNKNILINSAMNGTKIDFSMSIPEYIKVLSTPYWIPKVNKSPISTRFITASRQCVNKLERVC